MTINVCSLSLCVCVCVSELGSAPPLLPCLSLMLESVLQADPRLMERTKAKLFSCLISALQIQGLNGTVTSHVLMSLTCVCVCVCATVYP